MYKREKTMKKELIDYSVFLYNPESDKEVSQMILRHPEFKDLTDSNPYSKNKDVVTFDTKMIAKYAIYLYDVNTPLRIKYPLLYPRKKIAAEMAGYELDKNGKFKDQNVEDMLLGKFEKVQGAINSYVFGFGSPKYIALVSYWSLLTSEMSKATSFTSDNAKDTIKNIKDLEALIEEATSSIYGGKENQDFLRALYQSIEGDRLRSMLSPEGIADAIEKGEEPIGGFNPYGNYKKDEMKFVGDE